MTTLNSKGPSSPLSRPVLPPLDTASNRPLAPQHQHWSAAPAGAEGLVASPAVSSALNPFPTAFPSRGEAVEPRPTKPESAAVSQRIFAHLETIGGLQKDIAKEHQKLEGIGGGDWAGWARDKDGFGGAAEEGEKLTSGAPGKNKDDKDKTSKTSESMASYEKMAEGFTARQDGIEKIMEKLSSLSTALKEFHALPSPVLFPATNRSSQPSRSRAAAATAAENYAVNRHSTLPHPSHADSSRAEHRLSR